LRDGEVESILFCRVDRRVWEEELFINGPVFFNFIKEQGLVMIVEELLGATRELKLGWPHIDSPFQPFANDVAEDFPEEEIFRGDEVHIEVHANHEYVLLISEKVLDDVEKARLPRSPISLKGQMKIISTPIEVDIIFNFVHFPVTPPQGGIFLNRPREIIGVSHHDPRK